MEGRYAEDNFMEYRNILIDTSVIIDFLRKKDKPNTVLWRLKAAHDCFVSSITVFELMAGADSPEKRVEVHRLLRWITPLPLDAGVARIAARFHQDLRKRNELIEFRDLFIAASAYVHGYPLATFNTKHFSRLSQIVRLDL